MPMADVVLAVRARASKGHSMVIGASLGWAGTTTLQGCFVPCPEPFPRFRYRAIHAGWELLGARGTSLRVLGGASWDAFPNHVEGVRRGWSLRSDVASPAVGPVALVMHVQGVTATSGPAGLGMWGGGLGFRLR
jgi:hypothetical protein